ncbi:MAG: hypothetical protein ABSG87_02725 [Verrucomicrobiota bacterium]
MQARLRRIFCVCILCLAVFQFSENTVDPDLWGHVLFGQQFLQSGHLAKAEPYSWTAAGHEWINHEVGAEIILGAAHRRVAIKQMTPATRVVAWAFGALAVVEISFGFAARPQIFSALALAIEFRLLQKIHCGRWLWALALPPLFALWINTHGGVLAGIILLFIVAIASTVQLLLKKSKSKIALLLTDECPPRVAVMLWFSAIVSTAALLLNPWGIELIRWLIGSAFWFRPEIEEWNAVAPFDWNHGAFFFCAALAVASFLFSQKQRALWEIAVVTALGVIAFRSVRNTPLFCIAALAFVPPHLANVLERLRVHFQRLEKFVQPISAQKKITAIFAIVSVGILAATFTLHKQRAWTMEIPRQQYPVAALQFIREHDLRGNLLVFFDWGEQCIWELPDSRVSIDGRLDTGYPRDVIAAHWKFYNGDPVDKNALDIDRADLALLPANLAGGFTLAKQYHWQPVYVDNLAVVLVKNPSRFSKLAGLKLPAQGDAQSTQGRAAFPNSLSQRISESH